MQFQNKNRLAYLGALTLLFSYAEFLLPHFIPFFKLGLGNIVILLALNLPFPDFFFLTLIKSITSSMLNGTLLSPFFLVSICQSVISGLIMKFMNRFSSRIFSLYGISIAGSTISALVQVLVSSVYLGGQTLRITGPMLIFSLVSGILTAFFASILKIPLTAPLLKITTETFTSRKNIFICILILLFSIACFMLNNLWLLLAALILAFIFQIISGRKILILPHIYIWIFVILIALLSPSGKVLLSLGKIKITEDALFEGIRKSAKLSIAAAVSQCAASVRPGEKSVFGMTLAYYDGLLSNFKNQTGNFFVRLQKTLNSTEL